MSDSKVRTKRYCLNSKPEAKCYVQITRIEGNNDYINIAFTSYDLTCVVFNVFSDNHAILGYVPQYEPSERRLYSNTTCHQISSFLREIGLEDVNYYSICQSMRNGYITEPVNPDEVHCLKDFVKNYEQNGKEISVSQYKKRLERRGAYDYYY